MNLKTKIHCVRNTIDRSFIGKDTAYCTYGHFNLWWLETILNLAGFPSHRDKIRFLESLQQKNKLNQFYEMIGNPAIGRIPALATWTEYKTSLRVEFDWNAEHHRLFLGQFSIDLAKTFPRSKTKKSLGANLALDGKDLRHTQNGSRSNVKTVQGVSHSVLLFSEPVGNENAWIKAEMELALRALQDRFPEVLFCVTGDAIYNNQNTRKIFKQLEVNYVLPVKTPKGSVFKSKLLEKSGIALSQNKGFKKTFVHFWKQEKIVDRVVLTPVVHQGVRAVLQLARTRSSTGPGELTSTQENLLFISNTPKKSSTQLLIELYRMKLSHWQVETYHQKKDVLLHEDRFHTSAEVAKTEARRNDFSLHLLRLLTGGTSKAFFQQFRFEFLEELWTSFFALWVLIWPFQSQKRLDPSRTVRPKVYRTLLRDVTLFNKGVILWLA